MSFTGSEQKFGQRKENQGRGGGKERSSGPVVDSCAVFLDVTLKRSRGLFGAR